MNETSVLVFITSSGVFWYREIFMKCLQSNYKGI